MKKLVSLTMALALTAGTVWSSPVKLKTAETVAVNFYTQTIST